MHVPASPVKHVHVQNLWPPPPSGRCVIRGCLQTWFLSKITKIGVRRLTWKALIHAILKYSISRDYEICWAVHCHTSSSSRDLRRRGGKEQMLLTVNVYDPKTKSPKQRFPPTMLIILLSRYSRLNVNTYIQRIWKVLIVSIMLFKHGKIKISEFCVRKKYTMLPKISILINWW